MSSYEIRIFNADGDRLNTLCGTGYSAMEAAETALEYYGVKIDPNIPVFVVAINNITGISFKFEMAQATGS